MPSLSRPRSRSLLAVLVLAGVALGVVPPPLAAAPPARVHEQVLGPRSLAAARWSDQQEICAPFRFTMVGFTWRGADHADVSVAAHGRRILLTGDAHEGPDPGTEGDDATVATAPLWLGDTGCVRVRLRSEDGERLRRVSAVFIDSRERSSSLLGSIGHRLISAWRGLAGAPAQAWTPQPGIVSRAGWGANEGWRNCSPTYMDRVDVAYVHHTATGNSYSKSDVPSIMRGIYRYHTSAPLSYCDIAYNFLIDRFGRVFEGRYGGITKPVQGGHAAGFNERTVGIAAIGDYTSKAPETALIRAFRRLIAWRLDVAHVRPASQATLTSSYGGGTSRYAAGTKVRVYRVIGHRRTNATGCPGDRLAAKVGAIRNGADRIGHPKIYNPRASDRDIVLTKGEETAITASISQDSTRWRVKIFDPSGAVVRDVSRVTRTVDVTWSPPPTVAPGDYRVRILASNSADRARRATLTLRVCTSGDPASPGRCPSA